MSLEKFDLKHLAGKMFGFLAALALCLTWLLAANLAPAGATNTIGDKTTAITITVNDNGTVTTAGVFTVGELQSMPQTKSIYSAYNNNTEKKYYVTEGVALTELLARAGIDLHNIDRFTFTATDNYTRTFTSAYLLETPRYCYPNLEDNASTEGAKPVQPVLALKSMEFSQYSQADYEQMDDYYAVRLFFGQNEQDLVNDQGYVKWVSQIELFTKPLNDQAPALTADFNHYAVGQAVNINFADAPLWRGAITAITVDGASIAGKYSVAAGTITINGSVFDAEKDYHIVIKARGYQDAVVIQHKGAWPVIFTVDGVDGAQRAYTMADLRAMPATTEQFGPLTCKGVALTELLAAEIADASRRAQINVTDAATFPIAPVTVADLRDPANRYLLVYEIDGAPLTIGPDNQTALRIYWGMGVTYKHVYGITVEGFTHPAYTVTPAADAATCQTVATVDGARIMAVNSGVSGLKYFAAQVTPLTAHEGGEAVVWVHLRNGAQESISVTKADFDVLTSVQAGFNVQAGDLIKVYVVGDLTNEAKK